MSLNRFLKFLYVRCLVQTLFLKLSIPFLNSFNVLIAFMDLFTLLTNLLLVVSFHLGEGVLGKLEYFSEVLHDLNNLVNVCLLGVLNEAAGDFVL